MYGIWMLTVFKEEDTNVNLCPTWGQFQKKSKFDIFYKDSSVQLRPNLLSTFAPQKSSSIVMDYALQCQPNFCEIDP